MDQLCVRKACTIKYFAISTIPTFQSKKFAIKFNIIIKDITQIIAVNKILVDFPVPQGKITWQDLQKHFLAEGVTVIGCYMYAQF